MSLYSEGLTWIGFMFYFTITQGRSKTYFFGNIKTQSLLRTGQRLTCPMPTKTKQLKQKQCYNFHKLIPCKEEKKQNSFRLIELMKMKCFPTNDE
jgi:hypothetical protein